MGFFMKSASMSTSQTKKSKSQLSALMKENTLIKNQNEELQKSNDELQKSNNEVKEEMKNIRKEYDEINEYMKLLGIELKDIKRNFSHGLVYIVNPQCHKRIILLTIEYQDKLEKEEIMKMGKLKGFIVFIFR